MKKREDLPPAIVVGGGANAVSIARSLGKRGIRVFALNEPDALVRYSKFCTWIEPSATADSTTLWSACLLGSETDALTGAVVLAASDAALMALIKHREALQRRFILDVADPGAQAKMLNKLETYLIARDAGVATPSFWSVRSWQDVLCLRDELVFPLLVKPRLSHIFEAKFSKKFFIADDMAELQTAFELAEGADLEVLLMEWIPGPDRLLCSYYTFLDEQGDALFDFTKRVVRRYPIGMGGGCLHVTDEVPRVREDSLRLFRAAGVRGVANAEFKEDPRTGQLKLIECNARFTAANGLMTAAGIDLAYFVYARAVGLPLPSMAAFRSGLTLWDPVQDFYAFRELRSRGELSFRGWLLSVTGRHCFPYFTWFDPLPSLVALRRESARVLRSIFSHARYEGDQIPAARKATSPNLTSRA